MLSIMWVVGWYISAPPWGWYTCNECAPGQHYLVTWKLSGMVNTTPVHSPAFHLIGKLAKLAGFSQITMNA